MAGGLFGRHDASLGHEAGGEGHVDVGRVEVGSRAVGCRGCSRGVSPKVMGSGLRPRDEVGRGDAAHGSDALVAAFAPGAEVADVAVLGLRPEGDVLRIEGALGDDGLFLELAPMEAVGGREGYEAALAGTRHGFESGVGGHVGPGVEEGREVMGEGRRVGEDDVVVAGAVYFEEAELGLVPVDAIAALGVAGDLEVGAVATRLGEARGSTYGRDRRLERPRRIRSSGVPRVDRIRAPFPRPSVRAGAAPCPTWCR